MGSIHGMQFGGGGGGGGGGREGIFNLPRLTVFMRTFLRCCNEYEAKKDRQEQWNGHTDRSNALTVDRDI